MGKTTALLIHFQSQNTFESLLQLWKNYYQSGAEATLRGKSKAFAFCLTDLQWNKLREILAIGKCVAESNSHNNPFQTTLSIPTILRFQQHLDMIFKKEQALKKLSKQTPPNENTKKDIAGKRLKRRLVEQFLDVNSVTHATSDYYKVPLFMFTMLATCDGHERLMPNYYNQTCSLPVTESELEML